VLHVWEEDSFGLMGFEASQYAEISSLLPFSLLEEALSLICWCFGLQYSTFFTSKQGLLGSFLQSFLSFFLVTKKRGGISNIQYI
jgi:hypothetical protein